MSIRRTVAVSWILLFLLPGLLPADPSEPTEPESPGGEEAEPEREPPSGPAQAGWVEFHRGNYPESRRAAARAHREHPEDPDVFALYAELHLLAGKFEGLADLCRERLERDAGDALALERLAESEFARGRYAEAETLLQRTLAADPSRHRALYRLVRLYRTTGRREEALRVLAPVEGFAHVGAIDTMSEDELLHLIRCMIELGRLKGDSLWYKIAGSDMMRHAQLNFPYDMRFVAEEAFLFRREGYRLTVAAALGEATGGGSGEYEGESEHGIGEMERRILAMNPNLPEYHLLKGNYENVLRWDPAHVPARLGLARKGLGVPDEIDLMEAIPWVRLGWGTSVPNPEEAIEHLDVVLGVNPTHPVALGLRASAKLLLGDREGYDRDRAAALDVNPIETTAEHAVALVLGRLGADEAAIGWEHRALDRDPASLPSKTHLAWLLLNAGVEERGKQALDEAWELERFHMGIKNVRTYYERRLPRAMRTVHLPHHRLRLLHDVQRRESESMAKGFVSDARILEWYVADRLEAWHEDLAGRYGEPAGELGVSLFKFLADYRVRIQGLDVAIGEPYARSGASFWTISPFETMGRQMAWGRLLREGYVRHFVARATGAFLPAWLDAGIARHETVRLRPSWDDDEGITRAVERARRDRLPTLADLATGPVDAESLLLAGLFAAYVEEHYGAAGLRRVVETFRVGDPDGLGPLLADVRAGGLDRIARALDVERDGLESGFRAWLLDRHGPSARRLARVPADEIPLLRAVSEARPDDRAARERLAVALWRAGDSEGAREACRGGRADAGDSPVFDAIEGHLARESGNPDEAMRLYHTALDEGEEEFTVLAAMADLHTEAGEVDEALSFYRRAFEACPAEAADRSGPVGRWFRTARGAGRPAEALDALEAYLDAKPDAWDKWVWAAEYAAVSGNPERADRFYEGAFLLNAYDVDLHRGWARVYEERGEVDRAVASLERAAACTWYLLGIYPQQMRQRDAERAEVYADLAEILLRADREAEAREAFVQGVAADPDHPRVREIGRRWQGTNGTD